ncbi:MAG: DUF1684 domain-containing protein [Actinomycetota bacterium]
MTGDNALDLLDWKRRVAELYAYVRGELDPERAWRRWRAVRDELFRTHPQSPIAEGNRRSFSGINYFDYDHSARVAAMVDPTEPHSYEIATSGNSAYTFTRVGVARFSLAGTDLALEVYWLEGYGGGLFLPFRDATAGDTTYGAGRYLLDTVKGADLGTDDRGRLILDFNFSYNPSCSYDPRWVCPLAPPPNRLAVPIMAGERLA